MKLKECYTLYIYTNNIVATDIPEQSFIERCVRCFEAIFNHNICNCGVHSHLNEEGEEYNRNVLLLVLFSVVLLYVGVEGLFVLVFGGFAMVEP